MRRLFLGGALAAAAAYLLDPQSGRRRRALARDRVAATARRILRSGRRAGRAITSEAYGLAQKATHLREEPKPQPNDATLARKVESEIFRGPDVPKGDVVVNAENGIVYLRGEVERPELIETLVESARKVQGVRGVENLLHLPGTEAPTRAGA